MRCAIVMNFIVEVEEVEVGCVVVVVVRGDNKTP